MTPPDSGEREVRRCDYPHCMRPAGHGLPHVTAGSDDREVCDHVYEAICVRCGGSEYPSAEVALVPLSLAQRILAALVYDADGFGEHAALAAELRARVEGKS